jgi:PAS domain S-box-containing protein
LEFGGAMSLHTREGMNALGYGTLTSVFTGAATGVVISSLEGDVLHCNDAFARIVNRTPDEIGSANILDFTHPEDLSHHQELLNQLISDKISNFVVEKRYVRPDGSSVWVRNSVSIADPVPPGPRHLVSICEDICDRKHAEQAIKNQEQLAAFGKLASAIVHEIRNPLEGALNLIFLAQTAATLDDARMYLQRAEDELSRASNIVVQGLQFPRQSPAPQVTSMVDLLQSVLILFRGKLDRAHVHVDFRHTDSPQLLCFPGEIRQVLTNLIVNAVDAMPGGGHLCIRLKPAPDWRSDRAGVRVTIADTGVGMSPRTRRKIYQAFFTTKGASGSGIGLWVTANIVNKHQGSIHVRSSSVSGASGTVFTLIFPHGGVAGKPEGFSDLNA